MRNDNRNINVVKPCIGHLIGLPYNELSSKKSLTVAFLTVVILPIRNDNSSQLKDVCLKLINVRPTFFYTKAFVYNSVAICLIMIKLLHHGV